MQIFRKTVNDATGEGHNIIFVNEAGNTKNGFFHKSTLFIDTDFYSRSEAKINYINRTWECYSFQTSMKQAVSNLINEYYNGLVYVWKRDNNKQRLTKEGKQEIANSPVLKLYNNIYNSL